MRVTGKARDMMRAARNLNDQTTFSRLILGCMLFLFSGTTSFPIVGKRLRSNPEVRWQICLKQPAEKAKRMLFAQWRFRQDVPEYDVDYVPAT